jgi:hypothetical protein
MRSEAADDAPPGGALHENLLRGDDVTGPSDRKFGLTMAAICTVIGGIRFAFGHGYWAWWLGAGVTFAAFAVFWPAALGPLNRAWLRLGLVLYKVVNPVVMALMFFSTITPIGFLMRLCGKDPLRLRRDPAAASYWIEREPPGPPPETMRNQF